MSALPTAPRPHSRPRPRSRPARKAPWGWLELVGVAQYAMPALMFLPFVVGPMRTASRVVGFATALVAWAAVVLSGRPERGRPFPARPWLAGAAAWLVLSIFHPLGNAPISAAAEAGLALAIFAPVFWVGRLEVSTARVGRLMLLIFLVCAASTLVGIAQFYYPGRFDPPNILLEELNPEAFGALFYETPDGRMVMRPCGLSDTPGGATVAGSVAFLLGLGLALRPGVRLWWRLPYPPLAVAGLAILYFSQVRQTLIVTVLAAGLMAGLFALRGDGRRALTIAVGGGLLFLGGLLWALRAGGDAVMKRFRDLLEGGDMLTVYYANRGHFVEDALMDLLPSYPIGAGLGRWGMTYLYFGRKLPVGVPGGPIWCEDQFTAWVLQGGAVMLTLYLGALAVTMLNLVRIVRTTPDRDLAIYAAVVTALCGSTLTTILGYVPFMAPSGLTFWILAAAMHAADQQVRAEHRRARWAARARAPLGPRPPTAAPVPPAPWPMPLPLPTPARPPGPGPAGAWPR